MNPVPRGGTASALHADNLTGEDPFMRPSALGSEPLAS